jgi:hypothetical protein
MRPGTARGIGYVAARAGAFPVQRFRNVVIAATVTASVLFVARTLVMQAQIMWDLHQATDEVAHFLQLGLAATLLVGSVGLGVWITHRIETHRELRRIALQAARRLMGSPPRDPGRARSNS